VVQGSGFKKGRNGCQLIADSHLGYKDGALRQLKAQRKKHERKDCRGWNGFLPIAASILVATISAHPGSSRRENPSSDRFKN
jgi:hypothetical protein